MTDIPWRYQNNKAVYPAVPVSEEEVKLTVVMTFSESNNGTYSEESQQMLAWTYFNKKAINMPGHEMFDVLSSMSSAWDILNDSSAVIQGVGRSMLSDREGKRAWMLDIYEMYYDRTFTANGERFRNVVNPNVRNVKDLWQTYGSNSAIDPTYGGTAYSHQDDPLQYPTIEIALLKLGEISMVRRLLTLILTMLFPNLI